MDGKSITPLKECGIYKGYSAENRISPKSKYYVYFEYSINGQLFQK